MNNENNNQNNFNLKDFYGLNNNSNKNPNNNTNQNNAWNDVPNNSNNLNQNNTWNNDQSNSNNLNQNNAWNNVPNNSNNHNSDNFNNNSNNYSQKNKPKSNFGLFAIIAFIIVILLVIGIFIFNYSKPINVFKEGIKIFKENYNSFNTNFIKNSIKNNDLFSSEIQMDLKSNLTKLKDFENYKLKVFYNLDAKNKYIDINAKILNNKKEVINITPYIDNNKIYIDLNNLYNKIIFSEIPKEKQDIFNKIFENKNKEIDDFNLVINRYLKYISESLDEKDFIKYKDTIIIDNKNIKVNANELKLDSEVMTKIRNNAIDKIIADDELLTILSYYTEIDKNELIKNFENEKNKKFKFNNVIDDAKKSATESEANMILKSIENYCSTSSIKHQLDDGYVDICANGVTPEEVKKMVNFDTKNTKIKKVNYDNKVVDLEIESNGYLLKFDGKKMVTNNDNNDRFYIITLYTKSNKLVGAKIKNENNEEINYTKNKNISTIIIPGNNDNIKIIYTKNDKENSNIFIDIPNSLNNENITINLDINKINFTKEKLDYKIKGSFKVNKKETFNINFNSTNIDDNYIEKKIVLKFIKDNEFMEINYLNNLTLNKEIRKYNNNKKMIHINDLTNKDLTNIYNNLEKNLKGTIFEGLLKNKFNLKY